MRLRETELRAREAEVTTQSQLIKLEEANLESARYELTKVTITAPIRGVVTRRNIEEGGTVVVGTMNNQGTVLATVADLSVIEAEVEVDETDIPSVTLGQAAEVTIDAFPDRTFRATVKSIGAGTGAEFSLLPAQNATGNWVKVTQRIPVHLTLNNEDAHFLMRSGLSATVTVDTGHHRHFGDLLKSAEAAE